MTTIQEIADRCGVSPTTVSAALNGRIQGKRRDAKQRAELIIRTAKEMGYQPHAAARSLRSQKTHQIGVVVCNSFLPGTALTHLNQYEAILGLDQAFSANGYVTALIPVTDTVESRSPVFRQRMLDAAVILGPVPEQMIRSVERLSLPMIWVDSDHWGEHNCLRRDEREAGRIAARLLAGSARIVHLFRPNAHYSSEERARGAEEVAWEFRVPFLRVDSSPDPQGFLETYATPETGIVVSGSYSAGRLLSKAGLMGLRPGKDFAVSCCEGSELLYRHCPELSCAGFSRCDMGIQAAEMCLALLSEGQDQPSALFPPTETKGETGRPG